MTIVLQLEWCECVRSYTVVVVVVYQVVAGVAAVAVASLSAAAITEVE